MICVDTLMNWGKVVHGHGPYWAHLGTDDLTPQGLEALHAFAKRLGLKRAWFQDKAGHPHYDLTANKHALALRLGAQLVTSQEFVKRCTSVLWRHARTPLHSYDVALWLFWPSVMPLFVAEVQAFSPFQAMKRLMRRHGLKRVAYASVRQCDGFLIYRCYKIAVCEVQV